MRAFVTGATGLLGGNLVETLLADGHSVTAVVRSKARAAHLAALGVELVEGDMERVAGFAPALHGHDILFHTAAYFREYFQPGDHWARLRAINVDGTVELLRAAETHGITKAIYTSSSGILGQAPGGVPAGEETPPDALVYSNLYFRSKLLAEQAVDGFLAESALPVVLIRPGWMFGPGDRAPTSSGQLVLDLLNRRLPFSFPGYGSPVDARDVARAMVTAVERGRSGERYGVGGDQAVRLDQIFAMVEELSGIPAPRLRVPYGVILSYAFISETSARLTGGRATATMDGIKTLRDPRPTSSARAVRELGASFRPLKATLRDEIAWFARTRPELVGPAATRLATLASA